MEKWQSDAVVISVQPAGETSLIVTLMTEEHGRKKAWLTGGRSKKYNAFIQPAHFVRAEYRAQSSGHFGYWKIEPASLSSSLIYSDRGRLWAIQSLIDLLNLTLETETPYPALYALTYDFFNHHIHQENWLPFFCLWEKFLLQQIGFGLSTDRCAVTGQTQNLTFLSPKTGRVVCYDVGFSWKDKLFPVPSFFIHPDHILSATPRDCVQALTITGFFLERHIFSILNRPLPTIRTQLHRFLQEAIHEYTV